MGVPDIKTDEKKCKGSAVDLETAVQLTEFGSATAFIIFIGGFCYLAIGFEYGLHAYILPFAQCDLRITAGQMGVINALFLGGGIISSFFWGLMADTFGRKKVLVVSMAIDGVTTILASWSNSFTMFALTRFVCGFMCGGPGSLVTSYIGEFCTDKYRSRGICIVGFCWTLSWMMLPGIAWLIIPSEVSIQTSFVTYNSWRIFVALIGFPNIVSALLIWYSLTETPKFLFIQGREAEALSILRDIFVQNTGRPADDYPVMKLVANYREVEDASCPGGQERRERRGFCFTMVRQIRLLFTPPHLKWTALSSSIYFANFFGYYGLGLWLPELFNRFEEFYIQNPDVTVSVCELSAMRNNMTNATHFESEEEALERLLSDCGERTVNMAVFSNTLITGAVVCAGNLLAAFLSSKVPGRFLTGANMLVAGLCACYIYFIRSSVQNIIVSALFVAGVNSALIVLNYCVVNLFPTQIRGMGVCIGILFGRIGAVLSNLVFGLLLDISCQIPIFVLGSTVLVGGLLCLLLPKNSLKAVE